MDLRHPVVPVIAVGMLSFLAALAIDFDGDGLTTGSEWWHGSRALDADSDGDGLRDDEERRWGTDPRDPDTDGDGLWDGWDIAYGGDPLAADLDGDDVVDGDERHPSCFRNADCDFDGIPDGDEPPTYDPLDPDTFDVGLDDGIVQAFEAGGQSPGRDEDVDGIPDAWEDSVGLFSWGPFEPKPGQRDLLIEYLKVTGPDSGRFPLDMTPAYHAVAQMFADRGITLQWIETTVDLGSEHRPGFLDTDDVGYYREVLEAGVGSTNPYVTSIVLNPQQEQEDLAGDILGAAFLRSMIATVDYGAHAVITFEEADSDGITLSSGTLDLRPVLESHIIGARPEQVQQLRFGCDGDGCVTNMRVLFDGRLRLTTQGGGNTFTWTWSPEWFAQAPRITSEGRYLQLRAVAADVDVTGLAGTIAHEIGHTLGLCHAHDPDCYQEFTYQDAVDRHQSTMSYGAPTGTLHFLESEWRQVEAYIRCPPQEPIRLLAKGGTDDAFYEAKYESSFRQAVDLRACEERGALPQTVHRMGAPVNGWGPGFGLLAGYVAGTVLIGAAAYFSRR